jgi:hypothetical protein
LLQISALIIPELQERAEFSISERSPVLRQIANGFPSKDHRVCFIRSGAKAHFFFIAYGTAEAEARALIPPPQQAKIGLDWGPGLQRLKPVLNNAHSF